MCADVMEHLPEDRVPAALASMATYCQRIAFKVANFPSVLGENLHLTRQPVDWWLRTMAATMPGRARQVGYPSRREEYVILWEAT